MSANAFQKICPLCQMSNEPNALICRHCGAHIELRPNIPTTRLDPVQIEQSRHRPIETFRGAGPAAEGVSLFLFNGGMPVARCTEAEFVLGRAGEAPAEPIVDLTGFEALAMGISRRHAMIRSAADGYTVIDLNSSNGTWLNGQRLVPSRPYPLPNGAVVQLGRLKLIVSYKHSPLT